MKNKDLFLLLITIMLTGKSYGQSTISWTAEVIQGMEQIRTIKDSIFGGQVTVQVEIDTITQKLQFKKFTSGTIYRKKLNSIVFGYDTKRDKKVPPQFEQLLPEIEKEIPFVKFEIPKDMNYLKTYQLYIELQ